MMKNKSSNTFLRMTRFLTFATVMAANTAAANEDIRKLASSDQIKAVILLKAVNYIQWPTPIGQELNICLLGSGGLNNALILFDGKSYNDSKISVNQLKQPDFTSCNIVYAGDPAAEGYESVVSEKSKHNFLSVSDVAGFSDRGGIMEFSSDKSKVNFAINITNSRRHGFLIGSHFLKMGQVKK